MSEVTERPKARLTAEGRRKRAVEAFKGRPRRPITVVPPAACLDCGLSYNDPGFADLVVPDRIWRKISPTGHEGGLLCPTCMVRAAVKAGLTNVKATFRSGPFARD